MKQGHELRSIPWLRDNSVCHFLLGPFPPSSVMENIRVPSYVMMSYVMMMGLPDDACVSILSPGLMMLPHQGPSGRDHCPTSLVAGGVKIASSASSCTGDRLLGRSSCESTPRTIIVGPTSSSTGTVDRCASTCFFSRMCFVSRIRRGGTSARFGWVVLLVRVSLALGCPPPVSTRMRRTVVSRSPVGSQSIASQSPVSH